MSAVAETDVAVSWIAPWPHSTFHGDQSVAGSPILTIRKGEARYFAFSIDGDVHIFCGNYGTFHVTSTILPAGTKGLPPSPASTTQSPCWTSTSPYAALPESGFRQGRARPG
jgi:hypothetical protein